MSELLGDNLSRMVLYGSVACGDAEPDSDTDVALIVRRLDRNTRKRIWDRTADMELRNDFPISPVMFSETRFRELKERERRIALDIEREGILL